MVDPDAGGDYASIDVDVYGEAVTDLETTHSGIADHILTLESDFTYFGVSTSNFNKLKEAKNELDDVLPGLRRRHSLALQLLDEQQELGFANDGTISFQGDILNDDFESVEEAQEAGEDTASLIDEDGEIPQEVYDRLDQYGHDPDFAEAFINALSPAERGLLLMEADNQATAGDNDGPQLAVSKVFATASFRIDYDAEFIEEMNQALLDKGLHPQGIRMIDRMAGLMQHGTWSYESVLAFSEAALLEGDRDELGWVDNWPAVVAALARNDRASAEFMHRNPDMVWEQSQVVGPVTSTEEWDAAWADFIKAATIDSRHIYSRLGLSDDDQANLAEQNAAFLINQVGSQEEGEEFEFSESMRMVFGDITEEYWDEFMHGFSSPAGVPTYPDGTPIPIEGVDPDMWDAFITEVMRSDDGMARMLALVGAEQQEVRDSRTGDSDATGWDGFINGRLGDMFLANFNQVMNERDADAEEREEARNNMIEFLVGAGFDPAGAGTDAAQQLITSLVQNWASDLSEEETQELDTSVLSYHETWRDYANTRLREGEIEPYDDGTVTWDGDPEFYEEHYGGEFTDSSGQILPLEEIKSDPDAMAAYNAWLQDPAVQRATNPFFQDENPAGGG